MLREKINWSLEVPLISVDTADAGPELLCYVFGGLTY